MRCFFACDSAHGVVLALAVELVSIKRTSLPVANLRRYFGVRVLRGIGLTMNLFIGGLAFAGHDKGHETQVKLGVLGVLGGSLIARLLGSAPLLRGGRVP